MKTCSLDTWIQLLGMLRLLGGLVFVGLEMLETQTIALWRKPMLDRRYSCRGI